MRAPEFPAGSRWLNTDRPLSLKELKGHVVLLDFWTYCCINCIHVLPDLAWLEEKYKDDPFVVIGVHSAKFDNEKDIENIQHAIERYHIEHPVLVDNSHRVWEEYTIRAWPSFVLIGPDGRIIEMLSGEGKRDKLDKQIGTVLAKGKEDGTIAQRHVQIMIPSRPEHLLSFPGKIVTSPENGHLFVSDSNHNRILELELLSENKARITRMIGSGTDGADDGSFAEASFYRPQGMAFHKGLLYVCDTDNHLIREADLKKETVRTVAGTGRQAGYGAQGGKASEVPLNSPWDAVAQGESLYIAMAGPHQLWRLDMTTGQIEVFAGSGWENIWDGEAKEAHLAQPSGITSDGETLYFADSEVSALRSCRIADGRVSTLVGSGLFRFGFEDGPFQKARLQHPLGVMYREGKVYVADTYNHAIRVADLASGQMTTLIGRTKQKSCTIEGEGCDMLPLNEPNDVLSVGNQLYITDTNNHLIRVFDLATKELSILSIVRES